MVDFYLIINNCLVFFILKHDNILTICEHDTEKEFSSIDS